MISRHGFVCACLLLASTERVESFSIPTTHSSIRATTSSASSNGIRPGTSLTVIMGGSETDLADIPASVLQYQDNFLENINARSISLFDQYQDAAGFEADLFNSQDALAQVASVLAARSDDFQDVIVGGSSTVLSALPDSVYDSFNDQVMMIQQLDGKMLAAATATGATGAATIATSSTGFTSSTGSVVSDFVDNSQMVGSVPADIDPMTVAEQAASLDPSFDPSFDQMVSQLLSDNVEVAKAAAAQATSTGRMDSSNKIMTLMEKAISSFDDIAVKSGDSLEDVAKQLSDQLYQSFGSVDSAQASFSAAPGYITKKGDAVLQGALDEVERVFESSTTRFVEKGTETFQTAKETPVKAILNSVLHAIDEIMKVLLKTMDGLLEGFSGSSLAGHVQHFQSSLAGLVGQTTERIGSAVHEIGHANIQQIAQFVLKEVIFFIEFLSKIFLTLMNALLKAFTGDTLMGHVQHLQANVAAAVSDTTHQLMSTLHDLGQVDIREAATLLISLVTFVAKIIFQVLSALVIVLSGQGIDVWTLQATGAVKQELTQLSVQASEGIMGLAESSISELGALLLQLLENTSVLLVEAFQALLESFGVLLQPGGPLSGALASDTIQSITDSASIMTANL
jgi:hypothetical protein